MAVYLKQKSNADSLRRRLRLPIAHGCNLPSAVDLRPWMTEIEDQGEMGSCVANAIAGTTLIMPFVDDVVILGALEYLYRRSTGQVVDVSRLFIDFNARLANINWSAQRHFVINRADPGDTFDTNRRAAIRGLQQYGFCEESLWPYDRDLYLQPPPQIVYNEAARRSIVPLKVPINIVSVKTCLAHQIPVLVGIMLSSDEAYHNRGWIQIPETPPDEGYHACLVVGYDDRTQHFIIRNSWGTDWVCKILQNKKTMKFISSLFYFSRVIRAIVTYPIYI